MRTLRLKQRVWTAKTSGQCWAGDTYLRRSALRGGVCVGKCGSAGIFLPADGTCIPRKKVL